MATAAVGLLTLVTSATFAVLVPPYESPDEHAHAEYVRQVAQHGLPREIPPVGAPERRFVYEWVQPPLYYVLAAPLARAVGTSAPTVLAPDPSSRLSGGPRWVVYSHERPLEPREVATRLYVLRAFGALLAVIGVVATVALTRAVTGSTAAAAFAGASLALVPQWAAILASVGNDGLSTTLAALAALSLWPLLAAPSVGPAAVAGVLSGAALSTKFTTACLVPGLLYALWCAPRLNRARLALAAFGGLALTGGWPFVANVVLHGDPLATSFKRAALVAGGFTGASTGVPGLLDPGFSRYFVVMVIEPFWARFGSLGAGLAAGSRGWNAYFVLTGVIGVAVAGGVLAAWTGNRASGSEGASRQRLARALVVTVLSGLALWLGANVVNASSMVVHWTPRHLMPLTAPLVALGALGAVRGTAWLPRELRLALGVLLLVCLSGLWAIVVRDVVAAFR